MDAAMEFANVGFDVPVKIFTTQKAKTHRQGGFFKSAAHSNNGVSRRKLILGLTRTTLPQRRTCDTLLLNL
jgi:hypothetical protein